MTQQNTQLLTPVGRLVQGDCWKPQEKDAEGNPLLIKTGPNTGQPRVVYYMALAIPKTDPGYADLWAKIHGEAVRSFPTLFDTAGNCSVATFAFKITDGDSTVANRKGKRPCDNEGFPGNWILHFSGGFAPAIFERGGQTPLVAPEAVKRGYFIRILGNVAGNYSQQMPGVYLNFNSVEFIGYGEEIVVGPDGAACAENPAGALPPGASATPIAPTTPVAAPVAPGVAPPSVAPGVVPAPVAPGVAPPSVAPGVVPAPVAPGVVPAPDFLNPPQSPAATYTLPSMPGAKFSKEQLLAAGHTEAQIATYINF